MKKKALLTSAVALVTASAMAFSPVSYKVIDKAYAASPEVVEAADKLAAVFEQLNSDELLHVPYDAAVAQFNTDAAGLFNIQNNLPNLYQALDSGDYDVAAVQQSLVELVQQLAKDYSSKSANLGDISDDLRTKFNAFKQAIAPESELNLTDLAKLLDELETKLLAEIAELDFSKITDANFANELLNSLLEIAEAEWAEPSNGFVEVLQGLYGEGNDGFEALKADFETFKDNNKATLNTDTYKKGAAALALSYAKYYLAQEGNQPLQSYYYGSSVTLQPDFFGVSGLPLSALKWSASNTSNNADIDFVDGYLVLNPGSYGQVTVSATIKEITKIPLTAAFEGVQLFSQTVSVGATPPTSGGGVIVSDLTLVSDYQAKADALAGKVADFLKANPDLYNNTLKLNLTQLFEETLRQALLVQAAGAVTVNNGVSTLNVTPAQMGNIYNNQLDYVLNASKKALEDNKLTLKPAPALIYNIGVTANGEFNLSKDLIDSLTSKGIAVTGLKSGDAVVEVVLDQLKGASKLVIKKAESKVTGAKSDTYTLAVTDADGKEVVGFEKAHRVTLPVNGSSNVTVAKVAGDSLTYVGGQYDAATRTITFYTNELGDFVVVENSASFNDIANLNWAKDKIQLLADKGLLLGKGNGKFDPNGNVTRAEFTTMLVRAFNLNASTELTFNDVSENAWYHDAISAAKAYGIVNGRSASVFDPNAKITREEMASMAANALKAVLEFENPSNVEELLSKFVDGDKVVAVHRTNVAMLKNEAIIQGKGKNNYDPKGTATRAEAAVVLASLVDLR
ncbi:hypothetical protein J40TS1_21350 [Paenibacillus montaniterrae]|uniref:SLH domain-containing protein n=1 Tax=Paenibacillus montaniterrae TaxID=429341 RepID=A0A920CYK9_9BACL|nr:S-layer homology domain-containing protein [Paenibacillus montaniterrae]GIP16493.1 hypothetical protein J40TS1_21350 [Paenibacillus montaniterrae]